MVVSGQEMRETTQFLCPALMNLKEVAAFRSEKPGEQEKSISVLLVFLLI